MAWLQIQPSPALHLCHPTLPSLQGERAQLGPGDCGGRARRVLQVWTRGARVRRPQLPRLCVRGECNAHLQLGPGLAASVCCRLPRLQGAQRLMCLPLHASGCLQLEYACSSPCCPLHCSLPLPPSRGCNPCRSLARCSRPPRHKNRCTAAGLLRGKLRLTSRCVLHFIIQSERVVASCLSGLSQGSRQCSPLLAALVSLISLCTKLAATRAPPHCALLSQFGPIYNQHFGL